MATLSKVVCIQHEATPMEVEELLRTAEDVVGKLEQHLISKGYCALADCDNGLNEVQDMLTSAVFLLNTGIHTEGESIRHITASLQKRITRLSIMLEQAQQFYATWLEALRSQKVGYAEDGRPARAEMPPRFSIET